MRVLRPLTYRKRFRKFTSPERNEYAGQEYGLHVLERVEMARERVEMAPVRYRRNTTPPSSVQEA